MERGPTNGKMEECIMENTQMIRKMGLASTSGLMVGLTLASGYRASKIASVSIFCQMVQLGRVCMKETTGRSGCRFLRLRPTKTRLFWLMP